MNFTKSVISLSVLVQKIRFWACSKAHGYRYCNPYPYPAVPIPVTSAGLLKHMPLPSTIMCIGMQNDIEMQNHISECKKLVLPKFSSELIQRTRTDRTKLKVLFCSVLVLSVLCSVWFSVLRFLR